MDNKLFLGIRSSDSFTITLTGDPILPVKVERSQGRVSEYPEDLISGFIQYSPSIDRFFIGGEILETGATFSVKQGG